MKFRKKPVEVEAVRWDGTRDVFDRLWVWAGGRIDPQLPGDDGNRHLDTLESCIHYWADESDRDRALSIQTLEGSMRASVGDWIIRGIKGEFYPCKPDIFAATYEPVEPASPDRGTGG